MDVTGTHQCASITTLYHRYHHPRFIGKDPIVFPRRYARLQDREVAGLVAAGLAYGRVAQIFVSVERVLQMLGDEPSACLRAASDGELRRMLSGFRHRWTTGDEVAGLLTAVGAMQREFFFFFRQSACRFCCGYGGRG